MNISARLREERERLGLSQPSIAAIGGVQKRAQINYESGERVPDANYLSAIAAAGADIRYVLTGQRDGPAPVLLTREQQALLNSYDLCTDAAKRNLLQTAALFAAGVDASKARPRSGAGTQGSVNQVNSGHGAVQIGTTGKRR